MSRLAGESPSGGPLGRATLLTVLGSLDNDVYQAVWEVEPIGAGAHVGLVAQARSQARRQRPGDSRGKFRTNSRASPAPTYFCS